MNATLVRLLLFGGITPFPKEQPFNLVSSYRGAGFPRRISCAYAAREAGVVLVCPLAYSWGWPS